MKDRTYASRSMNAFFSAALGLSSFFASACASDMNDGKSGETHFLCSTDEDCARHFGNDTYYCGAAKYCTPKSDGGTSHDDGGHSGASGAGGSSGSGGKGGAVGSGGDFAGCRTPPNS